MNLEDLSDVMKNSLLERIKDLKASNSTTTHPIDVELKKLGLVIIENGITTLK